MSISELFTDSTEYHILNKRLGKDKKNQAIYFAKSLTTFFSFPDILHLLIHLMQIAFAKCQEANLSSFADRGCYKEVRISKKEELSKLTTILGAFPRNDNHRKT